MKYKLFTTVENFIDHYYKYLSVKMDPEVVVQLMLSQELLSEDFVVTTQSNYHKNCLILEQIRLMNTESFVSFCELLKDKQSERKTGEMLLTCEYI